MKRLFVAISILVLVMLVIQVTACQQKSERKRPDFEDLGKIADRYRADKQESAWDHRDLNGRWQTVVNGMQVIVTIDFNAGVYSSDAPGTSALKLKLISERGLEVVFEIESYDGVVTERINCVFKDQNTISMTGNTGVPHIFNRVQ